MKMITLVRTLVSRGVAAFGSFVFSYILAFILSPSDYGDFFLAYTLLVGIALIVRIGMETATIRSASILVSQRGIAELVELRKKTIRIVFSISIVSAICIYASLDYSVDIFFQSPLARIMVIIFIISLPFYAYIDIQSAFVKALNMPDLAALLERGYIALLCGLSSYIYFKLTSTISIINASWLFLIASVTIFILGFLVVKSKYQKLSVEVERNPIKKKIDSSSIIRSFFSSLPDYAFINIVNYFLRFSPILFLGYFSSSENVGVFSVATNIAFIISAVMLIINPVFSPYFASLHAQGNYIGVKKVLRKCIMYAAITAIPLFVVITLFRKEILALFGSVYYEYGNETTLILAITHLLIALIEPLFVLLNMVGYFKEVRYLIGISCITTIVILIILVPHYGILGASLALLTASIVKNILMIYHTIRYFKKHDMTQDYSYS